MSSSEDEYDPTATDDNEPQNQAQPQQGHATLVSDSNKVTGVISSSTTTSTSTGVFQSVSIRIPHAENGQASAQSVALSPDGEILMAGTSRGTIAMWELGDGRTKAPVRMMQPFPHSLDGHYQPISSITFAPNGQYAVCTPEGDKFLTIARGGKCSDLSTAGQKGFLDPLKCRGHKASITSSTFLLKNSTNIITGSHDNTARLWAADRLNDGPLSSYRHGSGDINDFPHVYTVAGASQTCFVTAGADNLVQLWDVRKPYKPGNKTLEFTLPKGETVGGVCVAGLTIVARCHSGNVYELPIRKDPKVNKIEGSNSIIASGVALPLSGSDSAPIIARPERSQIWTCSSFEGIKTNSNNGNHRTAGGFIGGCSATRPYQPVTPPMNIEAEGSVVSLACCPTAVVAGTTKSIQVFCEGGTGVNTNVGAWMDSIDAQQAASKRFRRE